MGLLNTLVGVFIGIYGLAFLLYRAGYLDIRSDQQMTWMLYLFIFHRYLLMMGDALPSLDRCAAILFPLR